MANTPQLDPVDRALLTELIFAQHLERDDAIIDHVPRAIHPTHAASAEQTFDPVRAHGVARPE